MISFRFVLILALFFLSCSPSQSTDLRKQGKSQIEKLVAELRKIETKEDLKRAVPRLKKNFNKLADLLVLTRQFPQDEEKPCQIGEELFTELARLYEIPGARELIESSQAEAVHRLRSTSLQ